VARLDRLPFVYAVWAVREGVDLGKVAWALGEAKRRGLRRAGVIASARPPGWASTPGSVAAT